MKILLVDIENCPSQTQQLLDNLEDYAQVIICYAQSGAKIPIDWIVPLSKAMHNDNLKIIKMPVVKNNAADFGITFWAGVLMAQSPEDTHFDIISNDADLDCVVNLLISQSRSAKRIGQTKKVTPSSQNISITTINEAIKIYCTHLTSHTNKPAKETTLLNSIKSKLQGNIEPSKLLDELIKQGVVMITNSKVNYNTQKLNALAVK